MKNSFITCAVFTMFCGAVSAQTAQQSVIEDGGSGKYKAVMVGDAGLADYTIYRPQNIAAAVAAEGKLPVLLFGNGGCANNSFDFAKYLTELASHGYVVIAIGPYTTEPQRWQQPTTPQPQNSDTPPAPVFMRQNNADGVPVQRVAALGLLDALDWLQVRSNDSESEYFGAVDTDNVAAAGQSCGGSQALVLGTCGDKRIKTVIALNSGVTSPGDFLNDVVTKDDLAKLRQPIAYLIGGSTDIAYKNAMDDYPRINHVPVVMANFDVGHGGTYNQPHGGTFAQMSLAWLDLQLKGNKANEAIFTRGALDEFQGWTVESKNF